MPISHIFGLVGLKPNAKACLFWSGVDAVLTDPQPNPYTWRRFELAFDPLPGEYVIETRAMHNRGDIQPVSVPYNRGGYDFFAVAKFKVRFA